MKRIEEVLEKMDIGNYKWYEESDGKWYGIVEFWTYKADQDIPTEIDFDGTAEDFVKEFCRAAEQYDVDEEVELYVGMRGKNGVPNTVRELIDDCQEAKDRLMEIAEKLKESLAE